MFYIRTVLELMYVYTTNTAHWDQILCLGNCSRTKDSLLIILRMQCLVYWLWQWQCPNYYCKPRELSMWLLFNAPAYVFMIMREWSQSLNYILLSYYIRPLLIRSMGWKLPLCTPCLTYSSDTKCQEASRYKHLWRHEHEVAEWKWHVVSHRKGLWDLLYSLLPSADCNMLANPHNIWKQSSSLHWALHVYTRTKRKDKSCKGTCMYL